MLTNDLTNEEVPEARTTWTTPDLPGVELKFNLGDDGLVIDVWYGDDHLDTWSEARMYREILDALAPNLVEAVEEDVMVERDWPWLRGVMEKVPEFYYFNNPYVDFYIHSPHYQFGEQEWEWVALVIHYVLDLEDEQPKSYSLWYMNTPTTGHEEFDADYLKELAGIEYTAEDEAKLRSAYADFLARLQAMVPFDLTQVDHDDGLTDLTFS